MRQYLDRRHQQLALLSSQLEALSPLQVLLRGYAIVSDRTSGAVVSSVEQVEQGTELSIRLFRGEVTAVVTDVKKNAVSVQKT